jgi:hypothetical protein
MAVYAIENGAVWVKASPNAASVRATENNWGNVISPANLAKLPDATLVSLGVRKLDYPIQSPPNTYMNVAPGEITPTGDRATQSWVYADMPLEQAQRACGDEIAARAMRARQQGVVVSGKIYDTDDESLKAYERVGSSRGAGVAYPSGGVPFKARDAGTGVAERVRLNNGQYVQLAQALQNFLVGVADTEDAKLISAETAVDLAAVRAIDIDAGWPVG